MATKKPAPKAVKPKVSIYTLRHPATNEVRYVGKANNPKVRLQGHICAAKRESLPVHRWIRKLASDGLRPVMVVEQEVSESQWAEAEMALIAHHRGAGIKLLNITAGGDGATSITFEDSPHSFVRRALLHRLGISIRVYRERGMTDMVKKIEMSIAAWRQFCNEQPDEALNFVLGSTLLRTYSGLHRVNA